MKAAFAESARFRDEFINLRVTNEQKTLIDRAAKALRKSLSCLMLDVACREAESALLNQCLFDLDEEEFEDFEALLRKHAAGNPKLERLLQRKPVWESKAAPAARLGRRGG
jgi:uncharacterized protein (DUF1778 family)